MPDREPAENQKTCSVCRVTIEQNAVTYGLDVVNSGVGGDRIHLGGRTRPRMLARYGRSVGLLRWHRIRPDGGDIFVAHTGASRLLVVSESSESEGKTASMGSRLPPPPHGGLIYRGGRQNVAMVRDRRSVLMIARHILKTLGVVKRGAWHIMRNDPRSTNYSKDWIGVLITSYLLVQTCLHRAYQ